MKWIQRTLACSLAIVAVGCVDGPQGDADTTDSLGVAEGALIVCTPGERAYCYDNGDCNLAGDACVCDDEMHYIAAERCQIWHSVVVQPGQLCAPGDQSYCHYKGTCTPDGQACGCKDWWHGPTCAVPADACPGYGAQPDGGWSNTVCGGHGDCVAAGQCDCDPGFTGPACSGADLTPCDPNPCQNGGACTELGALFDCDCPAGFDGDLCADDADECAEGTHDCPATEVCVNEPGGFRCDPTSVGATVGTFDTLNLGPAAICNGATNPLCDGIVQVDTLAATAPTAAGQLLSWDGTDMTWITPPDDNDTLYSAGAGLSLSTANEFSLNLPTATVPGGVLSASCPTGEKMDGIDATGAPTCSADLSGAASFVGGEGIDILGNVISMKAPTTTQKGGVKSLHCPGTQKLRGIGTFGNPICAADANATYSAGQGLQLLGSTFSIKHGGVINQHVGFGALAPSKVNGIAATLTGSQNFDSGTFFIDHVRNRVGIKDTTPSYPLDVNGDARIARYLHVNATLYANNDLRVGSGSGQDLFVNDSANRVGINTLSPATSLHVVGSGLFTGTLEVNSTLAAKRDFRAGSGGIDLFVDSSSGRVGVGEASPSERLDVAGTARASAFKFRGTKTGVLQVPSSAFVTEDPKRSVYYINTVGLFGRVLSTVASCPTGGCKAVAHAPVQLPHGVTITRLTCRYQDNTSGADFDSSVVQLWRRYVAGAAQQQLARAEWTTSGAASALGSAVDSTISNALVSNFSYGYQLSAFLDTTLPNSNVRFYGCEIRYTYDFAGP